MEEKPPRKVRYIQTELLPRKIIDITGEDDPEKPTVVTITPGEDPYEQLDAEEGELLYTVGDETKSDIHPDDVEGDDLSVTTIDSLKELDSEKVWEICAEDLLEELGNEELFRRVRAVGYMSWQRFEANRTRKQLNPYEPSSVRKVAEKFGVSSSRIMDLQRGEAITHEETRMKKMLKAEKKEEEGEKKRKSRSKSRTPTPRPQHCRPAPPSSDPSKYSVPSGPPTLSPFRTTTISQGKHL